MKMQHILHSSNETPIESPSPKIKIVHRPSLFEGSHDILSSDCNTQTGFTKIINQTYFKLPESLTSSFADYESYVAFLHLQDNGEKFRNDRKSVVSRSRKKRGDTTSIDMTTLAERKIYT
jgi:hypothetical protein